MLCCGVAGSKCRNPIPLAAVTSTNQGTPGDGVTEGGSVGRPAGAVTRCNATTATPPERTSAVATLMRNQLPGSAAFTLSPFPPSAPRSPPVLGRLRRLALLAVVRTEASVCGGAPRLLREHGLQRGDRFLGPPAIEEQLGPPDLDGEAVLLPGAGRLSLEGVPLDLGHHPPRLLGVARAGQGQTQVVTSLLSGGIVYRDHLAQEGNRPLRLVRLVVQNGPEQGTRRELREPGE